MGLVADLQALKAVVGPQERGFGVRAKPKVGPKLQTGFQPSRLASQWQGLLSDFQVLEEGGVFASIRAGGPRPEGPEAPEALGSSMARNSHRPRRHGGKGLTSPGRHCVSSALVLLEAMRALLSFWTVTLPTAALLQINERDCWPRFVDRLGQRLRRVLLKRLGVDLCVGVVELQPKRTKREGMPCPHLHFVFQGRRHRLGAWAVSKNELDGIIQGALADVGIHISDLSAAGNVQQVKRSVRAYLSKYMTKGSSDAEVWMGGLYQGLIPRQWWLWSQECRELVESCTTQLPTGFLAWVWRQREQLLQQGRFYLQQCKVPSEAPATYRIFWNSVANLAAVMAQWHEHLADAMIKARQELGIYTVMGEFVYAKPLLVEAR